MRVLVFCSLRSRVPPPLIDAGLDIAGAVLYGRDLSKANRLACWLRGRPNPEVCARRAGVPVYRCRSIREPELETFLADHPHDVLALYRVPILPPRIYGPSPHAINLHPSLLPAYRGGDPLLWAVWDGLDETGCTVHTLEEAEDTGAIVARRRLPIPAGVTRAELQRRAEIDVGVPLLLEAIERLERGDELEPQPETSPTPYARRRKPDAIWRDLPFAEWPAERVWRVLRFTNLTPFALDGRSGVLGWQVGGLERRPGGGRPGSLHRDWRGFYVSLPEGRVRLWPRPRPGVLLRRLLD